MEAFSLLRYWRTNASVDATNNDNDIPTAVSTHTSETEDDDDDHGPFFDLQFSLQPPGDETGDNGLLNSNSDENEEQYSVESQEDDDECDLNLTSPFQSGDRTVDVSDSSNPQETRVSLMKSATKFRVMMLKLKKSKLKTNSKSNENKKEDDGCNNSKQKMLQNENTSLSASSDENKFTKKAVQEYLKKVKPLYVRVSKRYGEKLKPNPAPVANPKAENESVSEPLLLPKGNLPAGLRVVYKHLRKSRSAVTAVAAAPPVASLSNRRDDSLLQQQDGIQSAILHCKRSFKASRDSDCSSSSASEPASQDGKFESNSNSDGSEMPETNKSV